MSESEQRTCIVFLLLLLFCLWEQQWWLSELWTVGDATVCLGPLATTVNYLPTHSPAPRPPSRGKEDSHHSCESAILAINSSSSPYGEKSMGSAKDAAAKYVGPVTGGNGSVKSYQSGPGPNDDHLFGSAHPLGAPPVPAPPPGTTSIKGSAVPATAFALS